MNKSFVRACLVAILISGLVLASAMRFVTAQASIFTVDSISKPSAPEFSVRIVAHPYDVPDKTSTTIDEYTGKETITTQPGYHVENKSIEITIKNQPFTPYNLTEYTVYHRDSDNFSRITGSHTYDESKTVNFYYNIEVKGYFGDNWKSVGTKYSYFEGPEPNAQLDSPYTVISVAADYPEDAVLDFRVQARIGYYYPYGPSIQVLGYDFYGQESDWSETQTTVINESQTPTPSPTQTPPNDGPTAPPTQEPTLTNEQVTTIAGAAIVGAVIVAGLFTLLYLIKRR